MTLSPSCKALIISHVDGGLDEWLRLPWTESQFKSIFIKYVLHIMKSKVTFIRTIFLRGRKHPLPSSPSGIWRYPSLDSRIFNCFILSRILLEVVPFHVAVWHFSQLLTIMVFQGERPCFILFCFVLIHEESQEHFRDVGEIFIVV